MLNVESITYQRDQEPILESVSLTLGILGVPDQFVDRILRILKSHVRKVP